MKKYAVNYFKTRFRLTIKNFESPTLDSCRNEFVNNLPNAFLDITCKALLLQNLSETDFNLFKSNFISQFPQFYSKSQIRYFVFHTIVNSLVRYSFSQQEIKTLGDEIFSEDGFEIYFYNPGTLNNWGDILGPVLVSKLSNFDALKSAKNQNSSLFYTIGSVLQVRIVCFLYLAYGKKQSYKANSINFF